MAGHNFDYDPALLKYNSVIQSRHKYFRWTGRTARITFAYMFLFPAFIGVLAYRYEVCNTRAGYRNWY
ncbi:hypothetical protein GLAREA_08919 [Glarea lozoyensis ATCC 20868]|uniref:NADH-ubiquinone oxidoreductase B15 subunit n=1 Tax=Glarea lozoyensis (strain ATCC 20868 / MF5171) TaxID=1116229 RepID=S3DXX0_GLAL2|nr:uncharacterized protein GLAREA_08919 [Glarea lozoyensis ATCC 20868]EPE36756.1 hypothetical protein GLAREA_08919 [Glarea lozoyensis ATCC 20868]